MSILSATKFIAEVSMKIRRIKKDLRDANGLLPPDEQEELYEALRSLESEVCSREAIFAANERLRSEANGILERL